MLLLSGFNLGTYLLARRLITYADVMDGEVTFQSLASRNNCFAVNREGLPGLLVKQPWSPGVGRTETIRREATLYWLAEQDADFAELSPHLPSCHLFDEFNHILVLDLISESENLEAVFSRLGQVPQDIARQQAETLAKIHNRIFPRLHNKSSRSLFASTAPGPLLKFGRDLETLSLNGPGAVHIVSRLRAAPELVKLCADLLNTWRPAALIHGDAKASNWLMSKDASNRTPHLIDWELADIGDPLWDISSVLTGYLVTAMHALLQSHHQFELERVTKPIAEPAHSLWQTYVSKAGTTSGHQGYDLEKLGGYIAFQLLDRLYTAANGRLDPLSETEHQAVGLAFQLCREPAGLLRALNIAGEPNL